MSRSALCVLAASTLLLAQNSTVIRIDVNLVQVDAVVTDSRNKHVSNLKAEDFEILQDGKPQKITNFSYITAAATPAPRNSVSMTAVPVTDKRATVAAPPPPPAPLKPADVRRMIALVVDDLGLSFASIAHVHESLRKFVNQEMQPGDMVAIIRTSAGMGVLQQFTTDRAVLNAAIDRVKFTIGRVGVNSFDVADDAASPSPANLQAAADAAIGLARDELFLVGTLGALRYVIDGLHDMPGRKSVILFSESLPLAGPGMRRLTDAANRASVVINTIDPRGLQVFGANAADGVSFNPTPRRGNPSAAASLAALRDSEMIESQQGLGLLAQGTGGLFIKDNNRIDEALNDVVADTEGYYLIGYHPDSATFDSKTRELPYHKVQVRLKIAGLHVRSRSGFFGETNAVRDVPRTGLAALLYALTSPFSSADVHVQLTTLFNQTPDRQSVLSALLHIDARSQVHRAAGWL